MINIYTKKTEKELLEDVVKQLCLHTNLHGKNSILVSDASPLEVEDIIFSQKNSVNTRIEFLNLGYDAFIQYVNSGEIGQAKLTNTPRIGVVFEQYDFKLVYACKKLESLGFHIFFGNSKKHVDRRLVS